jgi:hypothetical protein
MHYVCTTATLEGRSIGLAPYMTPLMNIFPPCYSVSLRVISGWSVFPTDFLVLTS